MYALICGFLPFEDKNTEKLYKKILSGQFEKPVFLSTLAIDLLSKILHVDPKKRISVADIRNHLWYNLYK